MSNKNVKWKRKLSGLETVKGKGEKKVKSNFLNVVIIEICDLNACRRINILNS